MADKVNLTDSLKKLEVISQWFSEQDEVDVEAGLTKVKEAAILIKQSKSRLAEIENEFQEIEKEIETEVDTDPFDPEEQAVSEEMGSSVNLDDIPF